MSQFRLQNTFLYPNSSPHLVNEYLSTEVRRYEESFEHNSIKHVCTVNSQTDAILPKPQVRQKCNKEQSYKKKSVTCKTQREKFPTH